MNQGEGGPKMTLAGYSRLPTRGYRRSPIENVRGNKEGVQIPSLMASRRARDNQLIAVGEHESERGKL